MATKSNSGGKPPRPKTTAAKSLAPNKLGKPNKATTHTPNAPKQDMLTWEKKSSGGWVSGQSMTINPGDPRAVSRLRHSKKFKARGKKVIRPRVHKHPDINSK